MEQYEQIDDTGFGGYRVIQGGGFRYGVDAVLLASFACGETGARGLRAESVLRAADFGCGNGIVSLILAHKRPELNVIGVEIQPAEADRARRSIELNGLQDRLSIIETDIASIRESEIIQAGSLDAIVSNPPYFKRGAAIPNDATAKFLARHETSADIYTFADTASWLLREGGDLYMVHRPSRIVDILDAMRQARIEPKELQYVVPRPGDAANLVLVHGIKGAGVELRMLPEIPVRKTEGGYSDIVEQLYERV